MADGQQQLELADTDAEKSEKPAKTEGQQQLLKLADSDADVAGAVRVNPVTVGRWRSGSSLPGKNSRRKLELLFAIPRKAWHAKPGAAAPPPAPTDDKASSEVKTEGQRQLLEQQGTESELAKKLGCGSAIIGHWKRGWRVPGGPARRKMSLLFGIPQRAWDVEAGKSVAPSKPSGPTEKGRDDDILDITKQQILEILNSLDDAKLTKEVRARTRTDLTKLLALRARIEKDRELGEDRMVREHPEWARVKAAILKALEPFPEAAAAVAKELAFGEVG